MKLKELVPLMAVCARVRIYDSDGHIVKNINDISRLDMYSVNGVCCCDLLVQAIQAYKKDSYGRTRLDVVVFD